MDLYREVDWSDVLHGLQIAPSYNGLTTKSLVAAHLLPYLMPISSERALAREISELEALQDGCGFTEVDADGFRVTPTRPTLWHFRRRHPRVFPELVLRGIAYLCVIADRKGLTLPIVASGDVEGAPRLVRRFELTSLGIEGEFSIFGCSPGSNGDQSQLSIPFHPDADGIQVEAGGVVKESLADGIGFPVQLVIRRGESDLGRFHLEAPPWLDSDDGEREQLVGISGRRTHPYTACNVVVTREHSGRMQILLGQRLSGYGAGSYALPGGKMRANEGVLDCAERELYEETGLKLVRSAARPVSLRYTNLSGFPRVKSVGVLAPEWKGEPERREIKEHLGWDWYYLDELPPDIFEPSRYVLEDYCQGQALGLTWPEVEGPVTPLPLWEGAGHDEL